jgi:hypothetical protein
MIAETDDDAWELIDERQVDLILCLDDDPVQRNVNARPGGVSTFYMRLCAGELPSWCRETRLPDELSSFRLFEITYTSGR